VEKELAERAGAACGVRKLVAALALRYVEQQQERFQAAGIFGRWNDP